MDAEYSRQIAPKAMHQKWIKTLSFFKPDVILFFFLYEMQFVVPLQISNHLEPEKIKTLILRQNHYSQTETLHSRNVVAIE